MRVGCRQALRQGNGEFMKRWLSRLAGCHLLVDGCVALGEFFGNQGDFSALAACPSGSTPGSVLLHRLVVGVVECQKQVACFR